MGRFYVVGLITWISRETPPSYLEWSTTIVPITPPSDEKVRGTRAVEKGFGDEEEEVGESGKRSVDGEKVDEEQHIGLESHVSV
jgi:hypothetical protein